MTFVTFWWPLAIQDGMRLLSFKAMSATFGPVLALLDTVLEQIQRLHLPKQQWICQQRSILHRQKLDTFVVLLAFFWHLCPGLWIPVDITHSCKLPSISMSNLGDTSSRTTRHSTSPFSPDHLCPTQSVSEDWGSRHE